MPDPSHAFSRRHWLAAAAGAPPELFHLERHPSEKYDLRAREPEIAARLRTRLRAFARELGADTAP